MDHFFSVGWISFSALRLPIGGTTPCKAKRPCPYPCTGAPAVEPGRRGSSRPERYVGHVGTSPVRRADRQCLHSSPQHRITSGLNRPTTDWASAVSQRSSPLPTAALPPRVFDFLETYPPFGFRRPTSTLTTSRHQTPSRTACGERLPSPLAPSPSARPGSGRRIGRDCIPIHDRESQDDYARTRPYTRVSELRAERDPIR